MNMEDATVRLWKQYAVADAGDTSPVLSVDIKELTHDTLGEQGGMRALTQVTQWTLCSCISLTSDC